MGGEELKFLSNIFSTALFHKRRESEGKRRGKREESLASPLHSSFFLPLRSRVSISAAMASPRLRTDSPFTPATVRSMAAAATPASGRSSAKDEAIWRRLREAGFDEETVKRRDKAALIAYITKLETEMYDYQYNMGLLLVEKKEWVTKYEEAKVAADAAEFALKRDQAANLSALAEAKRLEESLKKALGVEKECVANIEKALHDMRAESAETKIDYESKMAEARSMVENAQKKFDEAESKLHAAESLHAEAIRSQNTASRNLEDVKAREDELRRRLYSFQSECDAKEKEINLQRQSLYDSQRILHQEQERLLEGQTLLNQREDYIVQRTKALHRLEKELEDAKAKLEEDCRALKVKSSNLDLDLAALATREEAVIKRESLLDKRERELLILQEKISSKEYDEIQRLSVEHQSSLERKRCEFESEIEERRKLFEGEMEERRTAYEVRESALDQREALIKEREISIELQLSALADDREDLSKKLKLLEEKAENIHSIEKATEIEMQNVHNEKEELKKMQVEVERARSSLEAEKIEMLHAQQKFELTVDERNELLVMETKLKEEIDSFRAKRAELDAEIEKLSVEKEKFEIEWELIDEKRGELLREAEHIAEERKVVRTYLKSEHERIKLEKEDWRNRLKKDMESLSCEREEFMSKMEREHSDWLIKIQREREDFVKDIGIQRKELENCIHKRQEEVENYLREKEEAFERERAKEFQHINSQKEIIAKQLEHVALELKRLDNERKEIALDREQREREWSEIKSSVEVLNVQREKLEKQRELLHADREEIYQKIHHLNKLEHLEIELESKSLFEMHSKFPVIKKCSNGIVGTYSNANQNEQKVTPDGDIGPELHPEIPSANASPPSSTTLSWVKKCAGTIFRRSPEKVVDANLGRNTVSKSLGSPFGNLFGSPKSSSFGKRHLEEGKKVNEDATEQITESSRPSTTGVTTLLNGRKRFNSALSNDPADFLVARKHQKMERQRESAALEEKSPICILQNGKSHDSEETSLGVKAKVLSGSSFNDTQKKQELPLEAGESAREKTLASELIADHGGKIKENEGYNQVNNDEVDEEESDEEETDEESDDEDDDGEASTSPLGKIWKILMS